MQSAPPRVIILGGGGFIGYNLFDYFWRSKVDVLAISRSVPRWLSGDDSRNRLLCIGNALSGICLENSMSPGSIVIDCLSAFKPSSAQTAPFSELLKETSLLAGRLDIASRSKVDKYIYISSGGAIYGSSSVACSELSTPSPTTKYGLLKEMCENVVSFYGRNEQMVCINLRVSNPYGIFHSSPNHGLINVAIRRSIRGEKIYIRGNPSRIVKDFIFMDDLCRAILGVSVSDIPSGVFNVGFGQSKSLETVLDCISNQMEVPLRIEIEDAPSHDVQQFYLDINKLNDATGFVPAFELLEGVRQVVEWEISQIRRDH